MSAIVMQHRAQQACNSCRKLKRKCIYNSTLGKCDRCAESGKQCVYEANATPSQPAPVAAPSFSYTNTAPPSGNVNPALNQYGQPVYLDSFGAYSVTHNGQVDIAYCDQRYVLPDGSRMAGMGPGNEGTYPPNYGQF